MLSYLPVDPAELSKLPHHMQRGSKKSKASSSSSSSASGAAKALRDDLLRILRAQYRPFRPPTFAMLQETKLASSPRAVLMTVDGILLSAGPVMNPKKQGVAGRKPKTREVRKRSTATPEELVSSLLDVMEPMRVVLDTYVKEIATAEESEDAKDNSSLHVEILRKWVKLVLEMLRSDLPRRSAPLKSKVSELMQSLSGTNTGDAEDRLLGTADFFAGLLRISRLHGGDFELQVVELLVCMGSYFEDETQLDECISSVCGQTLSKDGSGTQGRQMSKQGIMRLMDLHIQRSPERVELLNRIVDDIELVATEPGTRGHALPMMNSSNLASFYEAILRNLARELESLDFRKHLGQLGKAKKRTGARQNKKSNPSKRKRASSEDGEDEEENSSSSDGEDDDREMLAENDEDCREGLDDENSPRNSQTSKSKRVRAPKPAASLGTSGSEANPSPRSTAREPARQQRMLTKAETIARAKEIMEAVKRLICMTRRTGHKRALLIVAVKQGRGIVEKFLKRAMPFVRHCLEDHREEIWRLLRALQMSTRQMQVICDNAKFKKEVSLVSAVPHLRRSLEELIYGAKQLFQATGHSEAFSTQNLARRLLDGTKIQSFGELEADQESRVGGEKPGSTWFSRALLRDDGWATGGGGFAALRFVSTSPMSCCNSTWRSCSSARSRRLDEPPRPRLPVAAMQSVLRLWAPAAVDAGATALGKTTALEGPRRFLPAALLARRAACLALRGIVLREGDTEFGVSCVI
ncbi:Fanconi anemia group D2 protein (Protein FACD2) [Durusdinium trenchii]|uniref:Fanconi anemia group D2 protein (Protein FACD2) n=1 Tax=Durusdinium trenchii TaxID=1381693 RepID=A0ABP0K8F3_9DINO